ncbi:hypothetical protein [Deinococcus misasensis]|uniref:hypothetical protein n=1 Tax=Deinococcus misasensis TaxID=392413 RepID=UPI000558FF20|nr:hypothetical protein [Deinococcus misasensis]
MPETPETSLFPHRLQSLLERVEHNVERWNQLAEKLPEVIEAVERLENRVEQAMTRIHSETDRCLQQIRQLEEQRLAVQVAPVAPQNPLPDRRSLQREMEQSLEDLLKREIQNLERGTLEPIQSQLRQLKNTVDRLPLTPSFSVPVLASPALDLEPHLKAQEHRVSELGQQLEAVQKAVQVFHDQHHQNHHLLAEQVQALQGDLKSLQNHLLEVDKSNKDTVQQILHAQRSDSERVNQSIGALEQSFQEFRGWYQSARPLARLFSGPK